MRIGNAWLLFLLGILMVSAIGCGGCAGEDGADGQNGANGQDVSDDDAGDDDIDDDVSDDDTTDDDTADDDTVDDDTTDDDTADDDTSDDDATDDDTTDDDTTDDDTTDDDTVDDDTTDDDTGFDFNGESEIFDVEIDDVATAATTTVYFAIADADGNPVTNQASSAVRFGIAYLTEPAAGLSGRWVSYINRTEVKDPGEPGTMPDGSTTTQPTAETCNAASGVFTNFGDGTYSYQFSFDITNVTTPVAVTYEPALVHRVAMQYTGNADNAIFEFVPDGSPVGGNREIVTIESCNVCHTKLALHGGGRLNTKYCVMCHNPGNQDANSGNVLDFATMIHKIHAGEHLANGYVIWGNSNGEHDYSAVAWPQDIRHCTKCHQGPDAADALETPDGNNWKLYPRRAACGACHDTVDFSTHFGGQPTDENCTLCHKPSYMDIPTSHEVPMEDWTPKFQVNILDVAQTAPGEYPEVTFSVTDPTNSDAFWDIAAGPEWGAGSCGTSSKRLRVYVGLSTSPDYTNTIDPASVSASPPYVDALTSAVANGDGTFTTTSTLPIPADATGSGNVFINARPCADFDGDDVYSDTVAVESPNQFFAITDEEPVARRQVVAMENCNQCHYFLTFHGNARTNNIDMCVTCHGPRFASASDGGTPRQFKYLIHDMHARVIEEEGTEFPGHLAKCTMCHLPNTYGVPLPAGVLPMTTNPGTLPGPGDDTFIQPIMAACMPCHSDDVTVAHMEMMGGVGGTETCVLCHGVGQAYDVYAVHEQ